MKLKLQVVISYKCGYYAPSKVVVYRICGV